MRTDAGGVIARTQIYIGGQWVESSGDDVIWVDDPVTRQVIARVPSGTAEDVSRAADAARSAFDAWSRTTPRERAGWMQRIADGLTARADEFAQIIAAELGAPRGQALDLHVRMGINDFALMPDAIANIMWEEELDNSLVYRVAKGVVGAITPWNYPLHQVTTKVAGALAAGCTVILKPAAATPLTAFLFADLLDDLDLPAGVFNLVSGSGRVVGESLVEHPQVDMVSFTGSTAAGRRISELAARHVKPVSMELGGKSAAIVLDGADLQRAVEITLTKTFQNAGQSCSALTRLLVPRNLLKDAEDIAASATAHFAPDAESEFAGRIGPVVSEAQLQSIRNHIARSVYEGASVIAGGLARPNVAEPGHYVAPTVLSGVSNDMAIARDEVFGPVLVIIPFDSEDQAVELANDSDYGLSGAVWGSSDAHAVSVARKIRSGQVSINGGRFNPGAPFGGFKRSGHGRENGRFGIEEYLTYTSLQF